LESEDGDVHGEGSGWISAPILPLHGPHRMNPVATWSQLQSLPNG